LAVGIARTKRHDRGGVSRRSTEIQDRQECQAANGPKPKRARIHAFPVRIYIVAPSTHGANSAPPKSKFSLLVGWPEAVFSIKSKMRWPHCCTVSSPSRMVPQLTSMSSSMRLNIAELVASFMEGAGLQPNTLP